MTIRVAMWSGPRTISTALMRSFAARGDCAALDEPLYAHYLHTTGLRHPMWREIIASQPTDWGRATAALHAPCDAAVQYQKHMAHHVLPELELAWMQGLRHAFLLREPASVAASYARRHDRVRPEDLGILQQRALLRHVTEVLGQPAVVIHSRSILEDPAAALGRLCAALGIPYTPRMLRWRAGPRASDGVWASHWYDAVWASEGFGPPPPPPAAPEPALAPVVAALMPAYEEMAALAMV